MGVVYEAFDRERGSNVALKTLRRSPEGNNIYRFKAEFRLLQELRHPNLIKLHELHNEGGTWFFTMEIVDGVEFLEWVRPSSTPWTEMEAPSSSANSSYSSGMDWPLLGDESMPRSPVEDAGSQQALVTTGSNSLVVPGAGGLVGYKGLKVDRLRDSMAQLCRGLSKLHRSGKVHRDIKPSNILVTHDGRVVLLDFGLVTVADTKSVGEQVVGTPAYMAPEQAAEQAVGPEADWYSVGVLLYQALTDKLPFEGLPLQMLMQKQIADAPSPIALIPETPSELSVLCEGLLHAKPDQRIAGRDVLQHLGADMGAARRRARATPVVTDAVFVGRGPELESLNRAYKEATKEKKGNVTFLLGESGVGKSALVRHFASSTAADSLVFVGRCYQNESVPYKAFDGIIDALSEYMAGRSEAEQAALVPRDASLLLKAFPVLARVTALGQAPQVLDESLHPQEIRSRVFDALSELFSRLAARHPVLLIVDDLQWADPDSFALVERVMGRADAPPLMLLATIRTGADQKNVIELASKLSEIGRLRQQHIDPLPEYDALELAKRLLGSQGIGMSADAIAKEASGHPLFIEALARHAASGNSGQGPLKLEDALCARILDLPDATRRLLALVALAGRPISKKTLARAAELTMEQLFDQVEILREDKLLRSEGTRQEDAVEAYHGRVQDAALMFELEDRPEQHLRLALAFEGADLKDHDALYAHWRAAGNNDKALMYAELAGDQAAQTLAFDRAVKLYREANDLTPTPSSPLLAKLAEALVNIGHSVKAAELYEEAANLETETENEERLRARVATLLLKSGFIDRGIAAMAPILKSAGMALPKGPKRAIAGMLVRRLTTKSLNPNFKLKNKGEISNDVSKKLELAHNVSTALGPLETNLGVYYAMQHVSLALKAGDPRHYALALAKEAVSVAALGGKAEVRSKLIERAEQIAKELNDAYLSAFVMLCKRQTEVLFGEMETLLSSSEEAQKALELVPKDSYWERSMMNLQRGLSFVNAGRLREGFEMASGLVNAAKEAGDLLPVVIMTTGPMTPVWLLGEDSGLARNQIKEILSGWNQQRYDLASFLCMCSEVQINLFDGMGEKALEKISNDIPEVKKSLLLHAEYHKVCFLELATRVGIFAGMQGHAAGVNFAKKHLKQLQQIARPWAVGLAALCQAQLDALVGEQNEVDPKVLGNMLREYGLNLHADIVLGSHDAYGDSFKRTIVPNYLFKAV